LCNDKSWEVTVAFFRAVSSVIHGQSSNLSDMERVTLTGDTASRAVTAWIVFQVAGGQVLLPILVATFLFTRATRHPTLINMCITWMLSSTVSCLLFYSGEYHHLPEGPASPLCITQASLVFAIPPMLSASAFGAIYHVWFTVSSTLKGQAGLQNCTIRSLVLLLLPYVLVVSFGVVGVIIVLTRPLSNVSLARRVFYCSPFDSVYSNVAAVVSAVILLATLFFEIRICLIVRRNWIGLRNAGQGSGFDLSFTIRVCIFGIYVLLGFLAAIASVFSTTAISDLFLATVPVAIAFLFGSQKDVLRVWMFWKRDKDPPPLTVAEDKYANVPYCNG